MPNIWKPPFGSQIIRGHPLGDGLIGCWLCNEGSGDTVYDLSGYDNHGALTNMDPDTDWGGGGMGWALNFDGDNDFVDASAVFPVLGNEWTLMAWAATTGAAGFGNIISYRGGGSGEDDLGGVWFTDAGGDRFHWRIGNTANLYAGTWTANTITQMTVCRDSSGAGALYQDGAEVNSSTSTWTDADTPYLYIGSLAGASTDYLTGQVYSALVWQRRLTADEIAYLYAFPYAFIRPTGFAEWMQAVGAVAYSNADGGLVIFAGGEGQLLSMISASGGTAIFAGGEGQLIAALTASGGLAIFDGGQTQLATMLTTSGGEFVFSGDEINLMQNIVADGGEFIFAGGQAQIAAMLNASGGEFVFAGGAVYPGAAYVTADGGLIIFGGGQTKAATARIANGGEAIFAGDETDTLAAAVVNGGEFVFFGGVATLETFLRLYLQGYPVIKLLKGKALAKLLEGYPVIEKLGGKPTS